MDRRTFVKRCLERGASVFVLGVAGCGRGGEVERDDPQALFSSRGEIILYDTYAMALYFDGGLGPQTGIIKVDYLIQNKPVTLEFWHGHGGVNHRFTVTPDHFQQLKMQKKVTLETNVVADHSHKLFIDMNDPKWRVPGAKPVSVPTEG